MSSGKASWGALSGEIFVSKTQNDLKEIGNENFVNYTFTGICQNELGQWASLSDNKPIDFYNWSTQPPEKSLGDYSVFSMT